MAFTYFRDGVKSAFSEKSSKENPMELNHYSSIKPEPTEKVGPGWK